MFFGGFAVLTLVFSGASAAVDTFSGAWWSISGGYAVLSLGSAVLARWIAGPSASPLSRRQRRRLEWAEVTGRVVDDPAIAHVALERADDRLQALTDAGRAATLVVRGLVGFLLLAALVFLGVAVSGSGIDLVLLGTAIAFGFLGLTLPRVVRSAQRRDARRLERAIDRWRRVTR